MTQPVRLTILAAVVVFALIQVIRPDRTNPPVDPAQTLQSHIGETHPAVLAIGRACGDCHSNETSWPWYSHVAPISWLVAHDVAEGREVLNFSKWNTYPFNEKAKLVQKICEEVREGDMPGAAYTFIHRGAKLNTTEVEALCGLEQVALR